MIQISKSETDRLIWRESCVRKARVIIHNDHMKKIGRLITNEIEIEDRKAKRLADFVKNQDRKVYLLKTDDVQRDLKKQKILHLNIIG